MESVYGCVPILHLRFISALKIDEVVKSQKSDGTVKSSRCKARKSRGVKRTYSYAAMTRDAAQRRRWTFYEAVKIKKSENHRWFSNSVGIGCIKISLNRSV